MTMTARAVLVGINTYPRAPQLAGCQNDVLDLADLLVAPAPNGCNFPYDDVRVLTDVFPNDTTTAGIRAALEWLVAGAAAGDRLYFHYSGYGDRLVTVDTAGGITRYHDVICPVDYDFTFEHAISNDDFRQIFALLPNGVEFIWTSDCCHSGDLTTPKCRSPRDYPSPPGPMQFRICAANAKFGGPRDFAGAIGGLNGAFLGACSSAEKAGETDDSSHPNGIFAFYLLQALKGPAGLTMPLAPLVAAVTAAIAAAGCAQTPQLAGSPAIIASKWL
jgi:hypothetical protein